MAKSRYQHEAYAGTEIPHWLREQVISLLHDRFPLCDSLVSKLLSGKAYHFCHSGQGRCSYIKVPEHRIEVLLEGAELKAVAVVQDVKAPHRSQAPPFTKVLLFGVNIMDEHRLFGHALFYHLCSSATQQGSTQLVVMSSGGGFWEAPEFQLYKLPDTSRYVFFNPWSEPTILLACSPVRLSETQMLTGAIKTIRAPAPSPFPNDYAANNKSTCSDNNQDIAANAQHERDMAPHLQSKRDKSAEAAARDLRTAAQTAKRERAKEEEEAGSSGGKRAAAEESWEADTMPAEGGADKQVMMALHPPRHPPP